MVIIRGKVDPLKADKTVSRFRFLLGHGRWKMEYTIIDRDGRRVKTGKFKADPKGCFALCLDTAAPGTVEIKVLGNGAYAGDYCTVHVISDNDIVNLPRKLSPN
jgi:hypothetical protein